MRRMWIVAVAAWVTLAAAAVPDDDFWSREGHLYPTLPIAATSSDNHQCRTDSELLVRNLRNKTLWAMTMWDASAKTAVGVLYGTTFQLGNFDECMRVVTPIKARFCVAQVFAKIPERHSHPGRPFDLYSHPGSSVWERISGSRIDPSKVPRDVINWGLCVPASCSSSDVEESINAYLERTSAANETLYGVEVRNEFCTAAEESDEVTAGEIAFWVFAILLIALTVSSTVFDYYRDADAKESKLTQLWMTFSIRRNFVKLVGSSEETENHLDVLHGIKAISIISIVLGHRIGISLSVSASNFQEIEEHLRTGRALFFVHTDLVVDTFFFVSGLLACFFLLKVFAVRIVNPLFAILVRVMRLAPAYFFIIWYQASAASRLGSGPLWKAMAKEENRFCRENWWANVLFLSNYIKPKEMCMTHSWYIPCDFHFFVMATCLVILLGKQKKIGVGLLAVLTVLSSIIPAVVTYVNHIQPMIIFYSDFLSRPRDDESFHVLYVKSHNRATVYLIGMAIGYFLYMYKDSPKRVSKKLTISACFVWLLLMFAPMAYGSLYYDSERAYDATEAAIFASARRISWAVGFSIFVLVHRFGKIPLLSSALSSRPAVFLSNITYGIYLLHFNLISADVFQARTSKPFRIGNVLMDGVGDLLISGFFAIILFFILEVPCKRILREFILQRKIKEMDKPKQLESVNNNNQSNPYNCRVTVEDSVSTSEKL
ncbi:UNVERIFIED_CONTAM: hypothetical protein PYX00_008420 [Menopon gallinae]|uniref:Nose resistant-to-fluoxetine protein N-terminal domain-containing protein n=1 Tax=Menopon gallinae TaxID=328185 RepID=A0AAW2HMT6_9NEOP